MSIQEVSAEELAKLFHHYQGALFEDFHGLAKEDASRSWEQMPQSERGLMVAAARLALLDLATTVEGEPADRRYFAKPGEANWGC
ncbi:MAG: hypothetical protein ABSG40_08145 [Terriglobales bacterium]|jgi:hypothetical protein